MKVTEPKRNATVKRAVEGGMIYRSSLGSWTFRLDTEHTWRQVYLDTEQEVLAALAQAQSTTPQEHTA